MRASIIAIGSRGDVQPCVALGAALQAAGHEATVATHDRYRDLVLDHGVHVAPLAEGQLSRGGTTEQGEQWVQRGSKRLPGWVGWYQDAKSVAHQRLVDACEATVGADVVIAPGLSAVLGLQLENIFGIPLVRVQYSPPGWADTPIGRNAVWQWARPFVNDARRTEGLPNLGLREPFSELDARGVPLLEAFSPLVAPPEGRGDWVTTTGWWVLDDQQREPLSPELEAFLADGPAPVLIGFGAMIEDLPAMLDLVVDALARSGQRGIFLHERFDAATHRLPDTVFGATYAPHETLFPRLAAVVHHGGAGTVGMGLRAGLPTVVVPFFADQPAWGKQIAALGLGPEPIPRKQLTAENLAAAIRQATTDETMRARVQQLAEQLRDEDGLATAIDVIERYVEQAGTGEGASPPLTTRPWPNCPLCGATGTTAYRYTRDPIYKIPGLWRYQRCSNDTCGSMWLDPVPREDSIGSAYDTYYTHTAAAPPPRVQPLLGPVAKVRAAYLEQRYGYDPATPVGPAARAAANSVVRMLPGGRDSMDDMACHLSRPAGRARFLELGFGSGMQLERMTGLGWDVVGVDPDPKSCESARERGLDARVGTLESQHFDDGEFDAAYSSHVIEHVHDPLALLQEFHRVLRPGGRIVVLTPNVRSLCHERYQSAWFSLQPPFHLVLFTTESLHAAFEKAGFEVEEARSSSRIAFVNDIGSLDIRDANKVTSFDDRVPVARLVRGAGAQIAESARIALGREAGEELVFVGIKR